MKSQAEINAPFRNVYDDSTRAEAYATLEFPGTYYLAYRDLPVIIREHVAGREALDFGCGAGRSTRFLKRLGFNAIGLDISRSMIELARNADPSGDYHLVEEGDFSSLRAAHFNLIFSSFAFDNIPSIDRRTGLLRQLSHLLNERGRILILGSAPEIYVHEWASFTTKDFPENREAKSGDNVRIVMKDVHDARPVVDIIWFHQDYVNLFEAAEMKLLTHHAPFGRADEPVEWLSETTISPWVIYVIAKKRSD
ncbi:MAG TPA: class I SAM-dependent methyltransferase [Chthoniobacterales bacterium]|nr:class I SAM-dependent methyltransferase [Chthoniobacterales bacterium]